MSNAERLVAEAERGLRPLETAVNAAWWASSTDATDDNEARRTDADVALSDFLSDPELFEAIRAARAAGGTDPLVARQLDMLHDQLVRHQLPADLRRRIIELQVSIESTFARHRSVVGDQEVDDNAIKQILRTSDDCDEREEAWEASKTVGAEVSERVRDLVRLRNEAARSLGYRDHFALALATDELDETRLVATLDGVDRVTALPFSVWKAGLDETLADRFGCSTDDLRPHHYEDPFF